MISVTILTKNSERTLRHTLLSTQSFGEVLVIDTGSTDSTLNIAKEFPNVKIFSVPFIGFGAVHNLASSMATYDWILSIDSDEVLTPQLSLEIQQLTLAPRTVYAIQRDNFFNHRLIKWGGGWYPDRVVRLYNRKETRFSDDAVHEKVLEKGMEKRALQAPLRHTPYLQISDFLNKMQTYTTLFAEQNKEKKRGTFFKALLHSWMAFIKSYVFKRGFLGGREGYIISAYNSHTAFYKYLKLEELQRQ